MRTNRALCAVLLVGLIAGLIGVAAFKRRSQDPVGDAPRIRTSPHRHDPTGTETKVSDRRSPEKLAPARRLPGKDGSISAPVPAGIPFAIAPLHNDVSQAGDRIRYKGSAYSLEAGEDGVVAQALTMGPDQNPLLIKFRLDAISIGERVIAEGKGTKVERGAAPRSLVYHRGSVDETYAMGPQGFEQSFVIREVPAGGGAISVRQTVSTNLTAPADGTTSSRLTFTRESRELIEVSHAAVLDARGRKLSLDLAYAEGHITMTVPAAWVAEATPPIVVDPIIGSLIPISQPTFGGLSAVAFNPDAGANEWMVVWERQPAAGADIDLLARRINSQGQLIGAQIDLAVATGQNHISPAIAYAPAPISKYLVVWQEYTSGGSGFVGTTRGRLLNADGSLGGPIFTVDSRSPAYAPAIAFDGTRWFVAFNDLTTAPAPGGGSIAGRILGRFVATDGTPGNAADPSPVIDSSLNVDLAFTSGTYAITWGRGTGPADTVARLMDPNGNFTTAITVLDQTSEAAQAPRVSAKAGGFLFVWEHLSPSGSQKAIEGRLSDASLGFLGNVFPIPTGAGYPGYPRVSFSPTDQQWAVFYTKGPDIMAYTNIFANAVATSGAASSAEQLTAEPTSYLTPWSTSWNSSTDEFLMVFTGVVNGVYGIYGQRYVVPGGGPPTAFESRWKFEEGSGTFTADSTGNGNDGTLVGGVSWTIGKSGSAISLDGIDDYVSVLAAGMPAANAPQTVSWWMNYSAVPSGNQCAVGLTNNAAGSAVQCGFRNGQVTVWKYGGGVLAQAPAPSAANWHHFAYTFDGTTHRLYIDGAEANSSTAAPQTAVPDRVEFGRWSGGAEYYSGKLDEVGIYGQVLTPGQIADLAAVDPSVSAYFKFNEAAGTFTVDSSGNGHDGTLNAGITWTSGRSGSATQFDGSSGGISCVLGTGLPANNAPQTITWWMQYSSVGGVQAAICLTNPDAGSAIQAGFRNGQVTVWNWGGSTLVSAPAPALNTWHYFAYTFDGSNHSLYVDGVVANVSTVAAQTATPSRLDFGFTPGWGEFFAGRLDEVRIYDRALRAAEVGAQARQYSLEAYFRFDEGLGTSTADYSGNGHDGTLNSTIWAVGQSGAALQFDGSASNVSCTLSGGLPTNNANQTISWWMNYPSVPGGTQAVVCLTNPGAGSAIQTGFRNGQITAWNWGGNTLASGPAPSAGAWHHFAYTFDGTTHSLYVDGALVNSSTAGAQTAAPSRLDFGFTPGWGENFAGLLDEVRIYSRTLTAAEIGGLARDPSLAAYFKFDEGASAFVADSTGNGHDGTLFGGAWVSGVTGPAIQLDGTSYVAAAVRTGLPATNARQTISWWMNVPANPTGVQTAFDLHNDSAAASVQGGFRNGNVSVWNHGGNVLVQATPPAAGAWHHYVYSFDGVNHRLYVDGTEANTSTASPQAAPVTSLVFGRWNGGPAEYFLGGLDDVRIYTRTLFDAEILALFQSARPLAPVITSPVTGGTVYQARTPVAGTSSEQGLQITLLVDGTARGTATSGPGGNWLIYPTALSDGIHTLTATATNGAGGTSVESAPVSIAVSSSSNTGLTVTNATIQDGGFVNSTQPTFSATLSNLTNTGINPSSIVVRLDGATVSASVTVVNANTINISFTPPGSFQSNSTHSITIDGQTGNGGAVATVIATFGVDLNAPTILNVQPTSGALAGNPRPTISVLAVDSGGAGFDASCVSVILNGVSIPSNQIQVSLTNQNKTANVTFTPTSNLGDGTHVVTVQAVDRAGNLSPSVTVSFTIDTLAPQISISSPQNGASLSGQGFLLDATISDQVSGIDLSSVRVLLNNLDITPDVLLIPSNYTSLGHPQSVSVSGDLGGDPGANALTIIAWDAAQNAGNQTVDFMAGDDGFTPFQPPAFNVGLEIISGNGQSGMTGTPTSDSLVVRAYNPQNHAQSLDSVPLSVQVVSGGGRAISDKVRSLMTDHGGLASFKHVFGPQPGANAIKVSAIGQPEALPVTFVLTGQKPTLEVSPERGLCNPSYSTADYHGSALSRLFKIIAKKPDGSLLKGQLIEPIVSDPDGNPPSSPVGYFLPSRSLTDDNGEATFAFVIQNGAPVGPFKMKFTLPSFIDAEGKQIAVDVTGEVLSPQDRPPLRINYDDGPGTSGQGQIGVPGLKLSRHMRAKGGAPNTLIIFRIIEGYGTFEKGPDGAFVDGALSGFDACGNPVWWIWVDGEGKASVYFTPSSPMALVAIDAGRTDVFAVGRPEARLVSAQNPSTETSAFTFTQADQIDAASQFLLETRVPIGLTDAVTAKVESRDLAGDPVDTQGGVAPNVRDGISMAQAGLDPDNRFAIYRSPPSQPFTTFERTYTSGEDIPTVTGSGTLQVVEGSQLRISYTSPKFDLQDLRREASFKRDRVFAQVGGDQFKVELEAIGKATLPDQGSYHWTLQVNDGPTVPLPNVKTSILWMKVDALVQNLNQSGLTDSPVILRVPENNANRSSVLSIRATVDGLTKNPERYDMALTLSTSALIDSPDWKPGIRLPRNSTELNQAYPLIPLFEKFFAPITPANVQSYQTQSGASGLAAGRRLHWTIDPPPDVAKSYATTFALARFTATDFTLPFDQAGPKWIVNVLGVVCTPASQATDWEDFKGTLDHEFFHCYGQQFRQRPTYGPSEEWRYNYENTTFDFMKTNLWALPPQQRKAAAADYLVAARMFTNNLMEIEAHTHFALRVPTSHFMLRSDVINLSKYVPRMASLLRDGVPDTLITMNTVGKKVSPGHRDQTLIPLINYTWNLLPPLVRPARGPEVSLADPEFDAKVPKATDVWIPKFKP